VHCLRSQVLFLVHFFFNFSVCPMWWTQLAGYTSLHVKYTISYPIISYCIGKIRNKLFVGTVEQDFRHFRFRSRPKSGEVRGVTGEVG